MGIMIYLTVYICVCGHWWANGSVALSVCFGELVCQVDTWALSGVFAEMLLVFGVC